MGHRRHGNVAKLPDFRLERVLDLAVLYAHLQWQRPRRIVTQHVGNHIVGVAPVAAQRVHDVRSIGLRGEDDEIACREGLSVRNERRLCLVNFRAAELEHFEQLQRRGIVVLRGRNDEGIGVIRLPHFDRVRAHLVVVVQPVELVRRRRLEQGHGSLDRVVHHIAQAPPAARPRVGVAQAPSGVEVVDFGRVDVDRGRDVGPGDLAEHGCRVAHRRTACQRALPTMPMRISGRGPRLSCRLTADRRTFASRSGRCPGRRAGAHAGRRAPCTAARICAPPSRSSDADRRRSAETSRARALCRCCASRAGCT